jgi:DnaJ family protein A protein 2
MFFGGGGFPFGGGEHPFGGGEENPRKRKEVNTQEYYDILGVAKDASQDEIRRAYKKLAVRHHPDKGGDEAKFKEITEAADVLLDEKKREIYDTHGKEGLEGGMHEGGGADDLFSALFGGGRPGGKQERKKQVAPIQKKVEVQLEDFYCGKTFELPVQRKRVCDKCQGSGSSAPNADTTCQECHGHGVQILRRQIAPGFTQQMQVQCDKCEGTGSFIPKKLQCKECKGERLKTETKDLTVEIVKGMQHGEKVVFHEEGHQVPDLEPGDVIVILVMEKHNQFVRKGNDLLGEIKISLAEALDTAQSLTVKHLDGRTLHIAREEGYIISPGAVMRVSEEGMPKRENPLMKGDMYLRFTVEFPKTLPADIQQQVVALLTPSCPPLASSKDAMNVIENHDDEHHDHDHWECRMHEVDLAQFGKKSSRSRQAYEDDDDEEGQGGGGGPVQCQQM